MKEGREGGRGRVRKREREEGRKREWAGMGERRESEKEGREEVRVLKDINYCNT